MPSYTNIQNMKKEQDLLLFFHAVISSSFKVSFFSDFVRSG